jgi:hypothetical protein
MEEAMVMQENIPHPPTSKKTYRSPEFVVYGPLADLTKGGSVPMGVEDSSFSIS